MSPHTVADTCRQRWQLDPYFGRVKQRLRIKAFYGTSFAAVMARVRVAACLPARGHRKKRLKWPETLGPIMQIPWVFLADKVELIQVVIKALRREAESANQLHLFIIDY